MTISGDFGEEPKVTWEDRMTADKLESEVLIEGDGAALEDGEQVFARLWLGNGYSKTTALSTYGEDAAPDVEGQEREPPAGRVCSGAKRTRVPAGSRNASRDAPA